MVPFLTHRSLVIARVDILFSYYGINVSLIECSSGAHSSS
jgi:hypothetical protein